MKIELTDGQAQAIVNLASQINVAVERRKKIVSVEAKGEKCSGGRRYFTNDEGSNMEERKLRYIYGGYHS